MTKTIYSVWLTFLLFLSISLVNKANALDLPEIPEGAINALRSMSERQVDFQEKISSTLTGVGKNLVLEHTRGAKEVSLYRSAAPAVVFVLTPVGFGSGVIVNQLGHIVANWHVVKDYPNVVVVFKPKDSVELKKELAVSAVVEKVNQVNDLAVLRIGKQERPFTHLELGNSSNLAVGQDVHAIGHPDGEIWTYTKEVISQIRPNYNWVMPDGLQHRANVIQTQTPINPGNSGGPLLDDQGRLIGINSFRKEGQGLNYAVAVDEISRLLKTERARSTAKPQNVQEPQCTEPYDGLGQGWANILGCYQRPPSPPPDFWAVYRNPNAPPAYLAMDSKRTGKIDVVTIGVDERWSSMWHYVDLNCDGIIDLIGQQSAGEEKIDRYRKPGSRVTIKSLAKELDYAIRNRKIPYTKLGLCQ